MFDDKKFLEALEFGEKGYCHMKLRDPKGGVPKEFGLLFKDDPLVIYESDFIDIEEGIIPRKKLKFKSVDEMLAAGWIVD